MNIEELRAEFEAWVKSLPYGRRHCLITYEHEGRRYYDDTYTSIAFEAFIAGRAALQSQAMPYAGVTVWVGNKRCSHGVTKDELELSTFDILQAAFDHARRVEGEGE